LLCGLGGGGDRLGRVVQTRQAQPWLQPELLFQCHPMAKTQQKCLDILHGFTDKVGTNFKYNSPIILIAFLPVSIVDSLNPVMSNLCTEYFYTNSKPVLWGEI
jgi:hypothetical protein